MKKRHLFIILIINTIALAALGNQGPSTMREALGLFAMANIAERQQVALPGAFGVYPEAIKVADDKYLAPQPLWQQIGGSITYKVSRVFFGVDESSIGLRKFYNITSYLGNLIASTILIIVFSQALTVKGLNNREILLMLIPLIFFSLCFTAAMVMEVYLLVAALCFWSLHLINSGVYLINRDMPAKKPFMFAGGLLAFAGCLSLPALGIGLGFLAMLITQKDIKFQRAAIDLLLGAIIPVLLTVMFVALYSRQAEVLVPPWPEIASGRGSSPAEVVRYLFNATIGLNGLFIYAPLALIGAVSLFKRLNHFQKLVEKRKKLDHYARGQVVIVWSITWGCLISLALFALRALMNGVPETLQMEKMFFWLSTISREIPQTIDPNMLPDMNIKLGGERIWLPSLASPYGSMQILFLLPLLHYFNLHVFKEKPFEKFKFYYHEVVRIGGLIALVGLASPHGGYIAPFIWSAHKIAVHVSNFYPIGALFYQ